MASASADEDSPSPAGDGDDDDQPLAAPADTKQSYYSKGSQELAVETPVMQKRLETRRNMTRASAERLLVVLVGLPARGKSFLARKLQNYLLWRGNQCRIFNVGMYRRRQKMDQPQNADFFDDSNQEAARVRQEAATAALQETLQWLIGLPASEEDLSQQSADGSLEQDEADYYYRNRLSYSARRRYHRIAIFDATNSTKERRQWILQQCAQADGADSSRTGVLFLESICDDQELLQENFKVKITTCPDFTDMGHEAALEDLKQRIQKYESRYETIEEKNHQSYIKIFNLSSRLMVNHVYGRLAKVVLPAIMAWNTGSRPIFLVRAGETEAMEHYVREAHRIKLSNGNLAAMTDNPSRRKRSDRLGKRGLRFRDAVGKFIEQEGRDYMKRKHGTVVGKMDTGTSIAGLNEEEEGIEPISQSSCDSSDLASWKLPFPCLVLSSTMPRAIETATWRHPFPVKDVTNLNPLDMGDFSGMDLATIRDQYPEWYQRLRSDPFHTRFPGGESYGDLIDRLYPTLIDIEQELGLAVAVSHVSVLQVLVSYFRGSPIYKCMDLEIPMHTVWRFAPLRGGGWLESQHVLLPDGDALEQLETADSGETNMPIWGDSSACLPRQLDIR